MRPSSARDFDRRRPPFLPKVKQHSLPRSWKAWFQLSWYGTVTMASTPATTAEEGVGLARLGRRRGARRDRPSSTHASINSARTLFHFFKKGVGHEEVDTFFFLVSFQNKDILGGPILPLPLAWTRTILTCTS